jgi:hypothetical protein
MSLCFHCGYIEFQTSFWFFKFHIYFDMRSMTIVLYLFKDEKGKKCNHLNIYVKLNLSTNYLDLN